MTPEELHQAAHALYGDGLPAAEYIRRLAADLHTSEPGVRKWWYGQNPIPGVAQAAVECLTQAKSEWRGPETGFGSPM